MYQYVSALAKPRAEKSRWKQVDLHQETLGDIKKMYSEVWFTVTNTFLQGTRYLTLSTLLSEGVLLDKTPDEWFSILGNKPLTDSTIAPEIEIRKVKYRDAWRAGYGITYTDMGVHPTVPIPLGDRVDLMLTKSEIDYEHMQENVLVTVNGLIHPTDFSPHGLFVLQGGKSHQTAELNNVGIISFEDIGTIQQVLITAGMINNGDTGDDLVDNFYIETGVDMRGKTPILIAGGYMHLMDDVYKVINPEIGLIKVFVKRINMMHRLLEAKRLMSLVTLALPTHLMNETGLSNAEVYSDAVLTSYFSLPQSFIALLDSESVYLEQHRPEHAQLSGIFYWPEEPILPLQIRTGLIPEYWVKEEDGIFVISVTDAKSRHYVFESIPWRDEAFIDGSLETEHPYGVTKAFLLEIGSETIVQNP